MGLGPIEVCLPFRSGATAVGQPLLVVLHERSREGERRSPVWTTRGHPNGQSKSDRLANWQRAQIALQ